MIYKANPSNLPSKDPLPTRPQSPGFYHFMSSLSTMLSPSGGHIRENQMDVSWNKIYEPGGKIKNWQFQERSHIPPFTGSSEKHHRLKSAKRWEGGYACGVVLPEPDHMMGVGTGALSF